MRLSASCTSASRCNNRREWIGEPSEGCAQNSVRIRYIACALHVNVAKLIKALFEDVSWRRKSNDSPLIAIYLWPAMNAWFDFGILRNADDLDAILKPTSDTQSNRASSKLSIISSAKHLMNINLTLFCNVGLTERADELDMWRIGGPSSANRICSDRWPIISRV